MSKPRVTTEELRKKINELIDSVDGNLISMPHLKDVVSNYFGLHYPGDGRSKVYRDGFMDGVAEMRKLLLDIIDNPEKYSDFFEEQY